MSDSLFTRAHRRLRKERYKKAVASKSNSEFSSFFRQFNAAKQGWPITVKYLPDAELFELRDVGAPNARLHLARSSRVELYKDGVSGRLKHLWKEYLVDEIELETGDLVVDIGANIGEFSLAAQSLGARTFSIEPDPTEFRALSANCDPKSIINKALWNEPGEITFYSKNESGDSSVLEISDYSEKITVAAMTLDEVHSQYLQSAPIKLLKVEAEGAEPEILEAAGKTLAASEFIAVDVGPERGLAQENTVAPVLEALSAHGFRLRRFGNVRFVMLLSR